MYFCSAVGLLLVDLWLSLPSNVNVGSALLLIVVGALMVLGYGLGRSDPTFRRPALACSLVLAASAATLVFLLVRPMLGSGSVSLVPVSFWLLIASFAVAALAHAGAALALAKSPPS